MKSNQKGFTLIEGIIILVVVLLIAGAGYFIYNKNSDKKDANTNTGQQATNQETANEVTKKYLTIPEKGVRFPLTSAIEDAYYTVGEQGGIYFSTHYFDDKVGFENCKSDAAKDQLGMAALSYGKVGDDHFGTPWTQADLDGFPNSKIGDTYYWIVGNQAACWNYEAYAENDPRVQKASEIRSAFIAQSANIEKL